MLRTRLDPADAELYPEMGCSHDEYVNGDDVCVSKYQNGGRELVADAGWDGCTVPVRPK